MPLGVPLMLRVCVGLLEVDGDCVVLAVIVRVAVLVELPVDADEAVCVWLRLCVRDRVELLEAVGACDAVCDCVGEILAGVNKVRATVRIR
jgi:hypothetical protein